MIIDFSVGGAGILTQEIGDAYDPVFEAAVPPVPAPSVGGEYHAGVRDILSDVTRDLLENVPR